MGVNGGHRAWGDPNAKVIIFMYLYPDSKQRPSSSTSDGIGADWNARRKDWTDAACVCDYDAPHGHGQVSFDNVRASEQTLLVVRVKDLKLSGTF